MHGTYDEVLEDAPSERRMLEAAVLNRSISAMRQADGPMAAPGKRLDTLLEVTRLWSLLLEDLGNDDHPLDPQLRANLLSIGIFVLKHCDKMRDDRAVSFGPVIEITEQLVIGLKAG